MNKHQNILLPVVVIIAITYVSFFLMIEYMADDTDIAMRESETEILEARLRQSANMLVLTARENSVWNDAYDNIFLELNSEWILNNYQEQAEYYYNVDAFFIYGISNNIVISALENGQPSISQFLTSEFEDHLKSLKAKDYVTPITSNGFIEVEGRLYIFGTSLVQMDTSPNEQGERGEHIQPERRPVVIFMSELDNEVLQELEKDTNLSGLSIQSNKYETSGFLKLNSNLNKYIFMEDKNISFAWEAKKPGSDLESRLIIPLIITIILVCFTFYYFYVKSRELFRKLKEVDETKSNFLANMSHEVRTPLNAIIGFSELIKAETFGSIGNNKNEEYIGYVLDSGTHLLSVINDILDISKIEAGQLETHEEIFNIADIMDDSLRTLKPTYTAKELIIENTIGETDIKSDIKLFRQILYNLLTNAIKFTPSGGNISISSSIKTTGLELSICDKGIGMNEAELETALSTFGQVHTTYSRDQQGTGLGLPLVSKFMEVLNGQMIIKSQKGVGTDVMLVFPLTS